MVNFLDKYKIISCTNEIAHVNVKVYFDCIYIVLVYSSRMKCFVILTEILVMVIHFQERLETIYPIS